MNINDLRHTTPSRRLLAARLVAGLPLVAIGVMHLNGAAPMQPILEAAGIPLPALNAVVAPNVEVLAGVLLVVGAFARVGAALAVGTMAVALYAHAVANWAGEPPIALPLAVLAGALWVLVRGAGAFSLDVSARGEPVAATAAHA